MTFWLRALDRDNRFRYPPVSSSFDICKVFWLRRGVLEQIFATRFWYDKVGGDHTLFENYEFQTQTRHFA